MYTKPTEIGVLTPDMQATQELKAGEVWYVIPSLKDPKSVIVGDTLTTIANPTKRPLVGYQEPQSMVF